MDRYYKTVQCFAYGMVCMIAIQSTGFYCESCGKYIDCKSDPHIEVKEFQPNSASTGNRIGYLSASGMIYTSTSQFELDDGTRVIIPKSNHNNLGGIY